MPVRNNCKTCGKFYWECLSRLGKYCSKKCSQEGRKNGKTKECDICGNNFYTSPSLNQKYCSKECYYESENHQIEKDCKECGGTFKTRESKRNKMFCSRKCYFDFKVKNKSDLKGAFFNCESCGERFYREPNQIKKGVRFCSHKCRRTGKLVKCANNACGNDVYIPMNKVGMHNNYYCSNDCQYEDKTLYPNTIEIRKQIRERQFYAKNYFHLRTGIERDEVPKSLVIVKDLHLKTLRKLKEKTQ